jgi:predicted O-linked N-acetylglucosamine transferase (SPINDLY family)
VKSPELNDPAVQDRLAAQFADHFIDRRRLRLEGSTSRAERLAAYADVDLALDTFPYDGGVELLDALWMGVPVVHLRGGRFAGRRGDVILRAAGLADWIVDTREQYLERVAKAAADRTELAALRGRLRSQLLSSSLCDVPTVVRGLEAAYRAMWRRVCEDLH